MSDESPSNPAPAEPTGHSTPAAQAATPTTPPPPVKPKDPPKGFFSKLWHEWVKPLGLVILVVTTLRSSFLDWNDVPSGSMRPTILEGDRIVVNKLAYGFNLPFNGPIVDLPLIPAFNNPLDALPGFYWASPKRGDIVTFWNPTPDFRPQPRQGDPNHTVDNPSAGIRMVKRIVGVPGDTVRVVDGQLEITNAQGDTFPVTYQPLDQGPYRSEPTSALRVDPSTGRLEQKQIAVPVQFELEFFDGQPHFIQFLQETSGWKPSGHRYRNIPQDGSAIVLKDHDDPRLDEYLTIGDNRDNSADSRYYFQDYANLDDVDPVFVQGQHITGKAKFIAAGFKGGSFLRPDWSRFFRSFDAQAQVQAQDAAAD